MSFLKKIMSGRLFQYRNTLPEETEGSSPGNNLPGKILKFTCMDITYILEEFRLRFHQDISSRGQPEGFPKGGIMELTFSDPPDHYINEWMCREKVVRDGSIMILPGKLKLRSGADYQIEFSEAYCIGYKKTIHTRRKNYLTTITISPRYIRMGNEEFTNRWKDPEALPYYIRSGKI